MKPGFYSFELPLSDRYSPAKDTEIAVWHITESHEELRQMLPEDCIQTYQHETRNLHWLASRIAFHLLTGYNPKLILKTHNGKPYLEGNRQFISITHSGNYAAAAVSHSPVGIDLEHIHPRLLRVKDKFVTETEKKLLENDELKALARIWSAKESVYKIMGDRAVDFRTQQEVNHITGESISLILREENARLELWCFQPAEDYILTGLVI